uniref:NADP-dependent oxidoreductase domain-containing protein n=1 Tax=Timema genevievae TaxID=629358 RepID=A0A7R9JTZ2_TIMGE|nr:unnamed protein product [Timema genevievae]
MERILLVTPPRSGPYQGQRSALFRADTATQCQQYQEPIIVVLNLVHQSLRTHGTLPRTTSEHESRTSDKSIPGRAYNPPAPRFLQKDSSQATQQPRTPLTVRSAPPSRPSFATFKTPCSEKGTSESHQRVPKLVVRTYTTSEERILIRWDKKVSIRWPQDFGGPHARLVDRGNKQVGLGNLCLRTRIGGYLYSIIIEITGPIISHHPVLKDSSWQKERSETPCSCYFTRTDNVAGAAIGEITGWDTDSGHWVGDVAARKGTLPTERPQSLAMMVPTFADRGCHVVSTSSPSSAPPGEVEQAVKTAIDVGYRHFDCAFLYANEKEIGSAIRSKISEGVVKREDLYITSKLWNTHHRPAGVLSACKKSLENFGLDYLDLYLLHWPVAFKEGDDLFPKDKSGNFLTEDIDYLDTYLAMEECVRQKLTKSIGVSNFNSEQVTRVLEKSSIKPVMNQVECHPYLQQKKLIKFCKDHDIAVTAYSPLGAPNAMFPPPGCPVLMKDEKLKAIGEKYGKSLAQMALRFLVSTSMSVPARGLDITLVSSGLPVTRRSDLLWVVFPKQLSSLPQRKC